MKGNLSAIHSW